ncbi:MAG: TIGR02391 family protein [Anaerolineae bacterium]|nr:TIGR02391 family protein [Anaerolineae bacterium]
MSKMRTHSVFRNAQRLQSELNSLPGIIKPTNDRVEPVLPSLEQVVSDPDLLRYVEKLFRDGHHAQAVERAYKYLNNLVKKKASAPALDGSSLMNTTFSVQKPLLKLNALSSESEENEQKGYMQILAGVMTGIRNPRVHEHDWEDTEERALQLLSLANHLVVRVRNSKET